MFEKIKHYFSESLWNFPLAKEMGTRFLFFKWLRIFTLAGRGFVRDKCSINASSLTYYTLMSIVPMLAMGIAIARGFGFHETFRADVLNRFQEQNTAFIEMFHYADAFLEEARSGIIAGFGVGILLITVALLFTNLEKILNHIWGVRKLRSWKRILTDYFAIMLIAPIFFLIANSISVFVINRFEMGIRSLSLSTSVSATIHFLVGLLPYGLFWVLFSFIYIFMPNTKVRIASAFVGGLVGAVLYILLQVGYIYFQTGATQYGTIYGSMAALPLFLIWMQLSWFVLLFGAQVTYAHQTFDEHEYEGKAGRVSHQFKRLVSLWIVHLAIREGYITRETLVKTYHLPIALIKPILAALIDAQILHETRGGYVPSRSTHTLKISDVLEALEGKGENQFPHVHSKEMEVFEKALHHFRKEMETSSHNLRMNHLFKEEK